MNDHNQEQRYARTGQVQSTVHADAQEREHEVVAEIAWNLSLLLSCETKLVVSAIQELWDSLPHVMVVQTDSLPELTLLHRNRALSLAAAFNIVMQKHYPAFEHGSNACRSSSASSSAAVATDCGSIASPEEDLAGGCATVLQNLTALQMFHVRRAQALNSEYKDRLTCSGWF